MEATSVAATIDITTGVSPVITTLRTIITQPLLDSGIGIYATPLTTLAVDIAVMSAADTNGIAGIQADEFETAITLAVAKVVSTLERYFSRFSVASIMPCRLYQDRIF